MTRASCHLALLLCLWAYTAPGLHAPLPRPAPEPKAAVTAAPAPATVPDDAPVVLKSARPVAPAAPASAPAPAPKPFDPRYAELVDEAARRHGVSARLIHAVIETESAYDSDAVSTKGAVGLMQLMPATARQYGATNLRDPEENIHAGTRHLRELLEAFNHDVPLALAAYNAGAGAVRRYGGIPPYPETTRYVMKVLERYQRHRRASSARGAAAHANAQ